MLSPRTPSSVWRGPLLWTGTFSRVQTGSVYSSDRSIDIAHISEIGRTYKLLRILWWEAHFVTGLGLVEVIGPALKEGEDGVEEAVDAVASLLGDLHERLVVHRLELRV